MRARPEDDASELCSPDAGGEATASDVHPPRPGLPEEDTVVAEETFISPKGRHYRILKTHQRDPYDESPSPDDRP